jgi:hypothetical protein
VAGTCSVALRKPRDKVNHNSYTGLVLKNGKYVREAPEFYVKQMLVFLDDQKVSEFQMTSAMSPNPLIRFPFTTGRPRAPRPPSAPGP